MGGNPRPEVAVLARIGHVDATPDHGDRRPARVADPAVGGSVDAAREAGHDGDTVAGERSAERPHFADAIGRLLQRFAPRDDAPADLAGHHVREAPLTIPPGRSAAWNVCDVRGNCDARLRP